VLEPSSNVELSILRVRNAIAQLHTTAPHFFNPVLGATLTHYLKTVAAGRQSPDGPRPNSPRWMQLQLAYSGSDIEADLPLHG
jgi:hypothetical protein